LFGWLADYSFPFGQALELMLACFKGTIPAKVNSLQQQLRNTEVIPKSVSNNQFRKLNNLKQQVKKLNNLDSQAWLYKGILERLGSDPSANHEKLAKVVEALEYKRSEILQELEPRRPQRYRVLSKIQNSAHALLASQAEKDYIQLEKIITNLVNFTKSRKSSQTILSEVIIKLTSQISQVSNKISPFRLRLAYKIDELINVLSQKLILDSSDDTTDSDYQSLVTELNSRIHLLSQEFNNLLLDKQENRKELNRRIREVLNLTENISSLHRDISNRNADIIALQKNIQNLTGSFQKSQTNVDDLKNLISNLQKDIHNSDGINQKQYNQINQLQNQLSDLSQQKFNLQEKIDNLSTYATDKEYEIKLLQNEKYQLDSQKLELQRQNQLLHQKLEKINVSQTSVKPVATHKKISETEYQNISNQSEYEYVSAYKKTNGTLVDSYYRKKRKS